MSNEPDHQEGRKPPRTDAFERAWVRAVEDGVKRALSLFKVPRRDELMELERRIDHLAQRVDALKKRK